MYIFKQLMGVVFEPFGLNMVISLEISQKLGIENYIFLFISVACVQTSIIYYLFLAIYYFCCEIGYRISCICCKGLKMVEGMRRWWGVNLSAHNVPK